MSATITPAVAEAAGRPAESALLGELAAALSYPAPGLHAGLRALAARLAGPHAAAAARVERFLKRTSTLDEGDLEELYTRTFDMSPDATLDLGWHVHGETYERGNFLVMLRELERRHGIEGGSELPDNLALVLRLLDSLPADEVAPFVRAHVEKAIAAVLRVLEAQESPYADLVAATGEVLGVRWDTGTGTGTETGTESGTSAERR